ncbi:hypothetical protein GOP47_0000910 [Adiantum capillus-veneris]|uniref:Uncharacterized protein n=1 Tax=Adiantum capillus-veneris TaxID=13818 RepID=A0A9D4VFM1_ADICA|nr:hypothetical protein GOP47_0000910 [Adiantum capillus-veneris]
MIASLWPLSRIERRSMRLRANLLPPLKDAVTIYTRLDCLEELTSNEKLFFGLSRVLLKFPKDIDQVLCHFCFRQKKTVDNATDSSSTRGRSLPLVASIILLKEVVEVLPALREVLKAGRSLLLTDIRESMCQHPKFKALHERSIYLHTCPFSICLHFVRIDPVNS